MRFLVFLFLCHCTPDPYRFLDSPVNANDMEDLDFRIYFCRDAVHAGKKKERCAEIASLIDRYLELGGTCHNAVRVREFVNDGQRDRVQKILEIKCPLR